MNLAGNSSMTNLPVVQEPELRPVRNRSKPIQRLAMHFFRVTLLVTILCSIRLVHRDSQIAVSDLSLNESVLNFVVNSIPSAETVEPNGTIDSGNRILSADGICVGYLMQTSPRSDHLIGYSGPTNCLIAMNREHEIVAVHLLSSGDTIDHFRIVRDNRSFLDAFIGMGSKSRERWAQIDAVSGATLTSHAVVAAISNRVSGKAPSLKFSALPQSQNVRAIFSLFEDEDFSLVSSGRNSVWDVITAKNKTIGQVLTTTPVADDLAGYQGPTATLAGFDLNGKCVGIIVDQTYDNQPYANYLNDDAFFQNLYRGKTLNEIASMMPAAAEIDGVSGATMTSVCVAEGLAMAASNLLISGTRTGATKNAEAGASAARVRSNAETRAWRTNLVDAATVLLTLIGVAFSFASLRKKNRLRLGYQILVIVLLGFVNGHMLSLASVAGWSKHAIPWKLAPGLVFLSLAALLVPVVSRHQTYCQHICPFGALQQLTRNRLHWKLRIPAIVNRCRGAIPFALLAVTVWVAMTGAEFNLASIEPFDGFSFRIAGMATISILIIGLLLSLISPMAYCRFGCPTGAMLNYVRYRSDSDRIGFRDLAAVVLLLVAIGLSQG